MGYSPYCETCGSCGESGCCDPLNCAYKNMQECTYGQSNYKNIECEVHSFREMYEYIMSIDTIDIPVSRLKKDIEQIYDFNLDKIYLADK